MNYHTYLQQTYAAWLGKIIGIRLGAPVENWTHQAIKDKYGEVKDYLVDYDIFAADDDSNGPLFFVRALIDYDPANLTSNDIGNTILNYLQEYRGFFWWGGVGISTEHTAYENLKNGIQAPLSGKKETNGIALAEQIGGQIFSDCWGYVSGYDPVLAKELALKAASVTHDENGIQGAIFVAVAICLAYQLEDAKDVIEKSLAYLDQNMEYSKVIKDIMNYYHDNPYAWHDCLYYIQSNYGYDKYPGVCHIIPNSALMIMALCYGENDFSKTLTILCECGWDTDCNCGNVGSIMGALVGIDKIDTKWIKPINDIINCSSMIGYLNITTVSSTAKMFTDLAFKLKHLDHNTITNDFYLPYATCGFRGKNAHIENVDHELIVTTANEDSFVYKYSYYLPGNIFDTRYEPAFSPLVYPNETITFVVSAKQSCMLAIYVKDAMGKTYHMPFVQVDHEVKLAYQIPNSISHIITEFGIWQKKPNTEISQCTIKEISIDKLAKYRTDFRNYPIDHYGKTFGGEQLDNIQGWVEHSGKWSINEQGLTGDCDDHGLITSGDIAFTNYNISAEFMINKGYNFYLVFNCHGFLHYDAIGFEKDNLVLIHKDIKSMIVREIPYQWNFHTKYILKIKVKNDIMKTMINEKEMFCVSPFINNTNDINGVYGFLVEHGSSCTITRFELG